MNIEQKRQEIENFCQRLSEGYCIYDLKKEGWDKCPKQELITCGRCLMSELHSQDVVIRHGKGKADLWIESLIEDEEGESDDEH